MAVVADKVKQAMPFTSRYPELGTDPVDVRPLIDPELFELERERIFKQVWLYVARTEEIAQPGDYKLRPITNCMNVAIQSRTALPPTVLWQHMGK